MKLLDVDKLKDRAKRFLLAKAKFNRTWRKEFRTIKPCDDATGWRLIAKLQSLIINNLGYEGWGQSLAVTRACDELFRLQRVKESDYSWDDLVGFCVWYCNMDERLTALLQDVEMDRSDDSFGDLTDSLPLAGKEAIEKMFVIHPLTCKVVEKLVRTVPSHKDSNLDKDGVAARQEIENKSRKAFAELILEGENYVATALEDQCRSSMLSQVAESDDKLSDSYFGSEF